jgi:hypothetical protein
MARQCCAVANSHRNASTPEARGGGGATGGEIGSSAGKDAGGRDEGGSTSGVSGKPDVHVGAQVDARSPMVCHNKACLGTATSTGSTFSR